MTSPSQFIRLASNGIRVTTHTTGTVSKTLRMSLTQLLVSNSSTLPHHHGFQSAEEKMSNTIRWHTTQTKSSGIQIEKTINTARSSDVIDNASGMDQTNDSHDHHHDHHDHDHDDNDEEDEMEQEEMFVQPHLSIGHGQVEWGGPTRGGRLSEPTRFGDWERKGRCTDF